MVFKALFYIFSVILVSSACIVVLSKNTVYSALALIVAFFNAAILTLMLRCELISFVIMIVYVGAVAVFFLFIIMMLDLHKQKPQRMNGYLPIVCIIASLLLLEVIALAYFYQVSSSAPDLLTYPRPKKTYNVIAIGQLLYTNFTLVFQITGFILLIAMIGAIVLTLDIKKSRNIKSQNIAHQNKRNARDTLVLTTPKSGQGISSHNIDSIIHHKELDHQS